METPAATQPQEPPAAWSSGVRLGPLFGVDVLVHWRVLLLTAVAIVLATPLSPVDIPGHLGLSPLEFVALGVPMMVTSIFAHEMGHAVAAQALGLGARSVFVDVLKGHTLPRRSPVRARDEAAMCLAGPFVNLVIWVVLGRLSGDLYAPLFTTGSLMAVTASFNLLLVANFIPMLPLDGGRAFAAVCWGVTGDRVRGTQIATVLGPFLVGVPTLAVAGYVYLVRDDPVWGVLIAGSLVFELRGLIGKQFDGANRIAGLVVDDIMCPGIRTQPEALARTVVQDRVSRKYSPDPARIDALDLPYVAITDDGEVLGMLTPDEVERLALQHLQWDAVTVAEVMTPTASLVTVTPQMEVHTAIVYMAERQLEALLVVEDGKPVGCITGRRLVAAMEADGSSEPTWRPQAPSPPTAESMPGSQLSLFDDGARHERTDAA